MEKTWKPKAAGILTIVAGILGFPMAGIWLILAVLSPPFHVEQLEFLKIIGATFILVVLAIVGGIFALIRQKWPLALAGAVASTITFFPLGVPAIIFVTLGKEEFT